MKNNKIFLCLFACAIVLTTAATELRSQTETKPDTKTNPAAVKLRRDTNNVIVKEVVGHGTTKKEAIESALIIAVSQVRGARIDSEKYRFAFHAAGAGFSAIGPGSRSVEMDSASLDTVGTVHTFDIAGLIKTYDILEQKEFDDGTHQVKLRVSVYDYAARETSKRIKLAMMPVKTTKNAYAFLHQTIPAEELSRVFSQRLVAALTQTGKFSVLDRESIIDFAREKNMLLSQNAPLAQQAKLTETLGAEYLLVGTISNAKIEIIEKHLTAANFITRQYKARMTFDYRIVDSITKKIAYASTVQKYLENDQVRALADEIDPAEWDPSQVRDAFLTIVANDVITEIIANIYPIKIVDIQQDGTIILNQGGDRIKNGMLLDILAPGKELFDSDTGESLGGMENHIATAKIIQTGLRTSRATIITGDPSKITTSHVCRLQKSKKPPERGTKPDIKRTKSGGVKLPFDK